jgi:ABC-type uncharacterized transport system ATPase subunit
VPSALRGPGGVDIDVAGGNIFAPLGSNVAGKTTVVKILSTLLKADSGIARIILPAARCCSWSATCAAREFLRPRAPRWHGRRCEAQRSGRRNQA